jgi:predicted O-methyltransferase YrrM
MDDVPAIVARAERAARLAGFPLEADGARPSCCSPEVGRLLAVLAAGCRGGVVAELGTGTGYGTAWMVSALPADARLVSFELDGDRVSVARALFAEDDRVEIMQADAALVVGHRGPYDLLFADGGAVANRAADLAALVRHLRPGGRLVVDDVTPIRLLAPDSPFRHHDPKRLAFFGTPGLTSAELVMPAGHESVLVGTRTDGVPAHR